MRFEYRGVITARYTYVRTIDKPWILFDNIDDPYQMTNLIEDPKHSDTRDHLDGLMRAHMERIGDEFCPRDVYYERFGIEFDHRGKVVDLVENIYNRYD
jgi:hypothetical protein